MTKALEALVTRVENYIQDYVTLADKTYALPIALWVIGTYCFKEFDAYPYLVITAATKRSGKTRLMEMMSFCSSNPRNFAALTKSTLFRSIETENPTIFVDEAEDLNSESSDMRPVINVGYRRGATIPRTVSNQIVEFPTYCPKAFVLIGDVYDTLRDRSIVITMKRADTRKRFTFEAVREEGKALREEISAAVSLNLGNLQHAFQNHTGLPFLFDRDEEIWTSLFCIAEVFCKSRVEELKAAAVDIATEKTSESRRYTDLKASEDKAQDDEYARRLLMDLFSLFVTNGSKVSTEEAVKRLREIPTAPWRKFRGAGIDAHDIANMLSRFGVRPVRIAVGYGRKDTTYKRGYRRQDVEKAMQKL